MRVILLGVLLSFSAFPALAQWDWWSWGMMPDRLFGASRGAVIPTESDPGDVRDDAGTILYPRGEYATGLGGVLVRVTLLFDAEDRLALVAGKPSDHEDCPAVEAGLDALYGEGRVTDSASTRIVRWQHGDHRVELTSMPGNELCDFVFRPPER